MQLCVLFLQATEIIGVEKNFGNFFYTIRYDDGSERRRVPSTSVRKECLKLMMDFYEKNVAFVNGGIFVNGTQSSSSFIVSPPGREPM